MIPTLVEQLTTRFYEWEQRGRGWSLWDFPVDLEPPFVPFYYHAKPILAPIDDGRKPTFLSSLTEKIKKKFYHTANNNNNVSLDWTQEDNVISPLSLENIGEIREIKIILPQNYKAIAEYVEQCLLNITMQSSIIGFEILGQHDKITIQFACLEQNVLYTEQQIKAYFPESIVTLSENSFNELLRDYEENPVVVDFGLSEEFMRPFRTYDSFDPDPLTGIFGVLEHLEKEEIGLVQVLFKAAESPWAESMMRSVMSEEGDPFFIDAPEMIGLARDKCKYPLFAVNLRVLGKGKTEQQSWKIVKSLASCLNVYADSQSNKLIPLENNEYDDFMHLEDVILRRTHRSGMILSSAELISLVHFPSISVVSKKLRSGNQKSIEAPDSVIGNEFMLGENIHNGRKIKVLLNHEQRLRHMHVIGATGTGKSTLLLNLINQDMQKGIGFTVLDPHGDLIESILERVPESRFDDIVLFDPGDEQYPIGFNILEAKSEIEKNVLSSDLVEIFRRFSTSWGDQMSVVLGNAISALVESDQTYSLIELRRFLIEKEFRNELLKGVSDYHIQYFWEKEFPLLRGSSLGSILTRLDFFLRPKLIRNIVSQRQGIDIKDIVDHQKIFLVKLAQGIIGDENAYLLGSLLVSKLHQVIMQRQTQSSEDRKPFYLYIDEFQNFITPSMKAILSGARKYHLGLILAHQDLHQLFETDSGLANAIISNAGTRVCFRIGDFDAQKLQGGFSHFDTSDLQNLSIGEAVVRVERSDYDFNLKTRLPAVIDSKVALTNKEKIIEISRQNYGHDITDIKKEHREEASPIFSIFTKESEAVKQKIVVTSHVGKPKVGSPNNEQKNLSHHRYLQTLVKRLAEQRGFKAVIEEPTIDGLGRADVGLIRGEEKIACEISITTNDEHELKNIEKCFRAGYQKILICTPEKKRIDSLKDLIFEKLEPAQIDNIFLMQPEELSLFFEHMTKEEARQSTEKIVKGYRVKIEYNDISDAEKKQKREAIGGVIAQSLRRMKDEK
ncbi:MAG: type IV secretory system conjugative DNA transfer family protein [Ignavibacteriaceae bacterium]